MPIRFGWIRSWGDGASKKEETRGRWGRAGTGGNHYIYLWFESKYSSNALGLGLGLEFGHLLR